MESCFTPCWISDKSKQGINREHYFLATEFKEKHFYQ